MTREAIFCFDTATVRFAIYPDGYDGARVIAQIGEDPLRDLFGAGGDGATLLAAYDRHADRIDAMAVAHYRADSQRQIVLQTIDFDLARAHRNGPTVSQPLPAQTERVRALTATEWPAALAA